MRSASVRWVLIAATCAACVALGVAAGVYLSRARRGPAFSPPPVPTPAPAPRREPAPVAPAAQEAVTSEPPRRPVPPPLRPGEGVIVDLAIGTVIGCAFAGSVSSGTTEPVGVRPNDGFRAYGLAGRLGTAKPVEDGSGPVGELGDGEYLSLDYPAEVTRGVTSESGVPEDLYPMCIAVSGDWDALPRIPTVVGADHKEYRAAVVAWLAENGLAAAKVKIVRALRVDLEGDGTEEALISAMWPCPFPEGDPEATIPKGSYSVVLARRIVEGAVRTTTVAARVVDKDCGTLVDDFPGFVWLQGALDVDGDGTLEIITGDRGYEARMTSACRLTDSGTEEVMSGGYAL